MTDNTEQIITDHMLLTAHLSSVLRHVYGLRIIVVGAGVLLGGIAIGHLYSHWNVATLSLLGALSAGCAAAHTMVMNRGKKLLLRWAAHAAARTSMELNAIAPFIAAARSVPADVDGDSTPVINRVTATEWRRLVATFRDHEPR